jgi:hypothetical protein
MADERQESSIFALSKSTTMQEESKRRGRKKKAEQDLKKTHPIYCTDAEWQIISEMAAKAHMNVGPFIVSTVLRKGKG